MGPTDSQLKRSFLGRLKSTVVVFGFPRVFCGRGFPPGPIRLVAGLTTWSVDAVAML